MLKIATAINLHMSFGHIRIDTTIICWK